MTLRQNIPRCRIGGKVISLMEGKPCRLPDKKLYDSFCDLLATQQPGLTVNSIEFSRNLGFLPVDHVGESGIRLTCDSERVLSFQTKGISSLAGIFSLSDFTIVVYPKIFVNEPKSAPSAFLYMIEKILFTRIDKELSISLAELTGGGNLFEIWMRILYALYLTLLRNELLKGIYHEYTRTVLDSPRVSGKILVSRQALRPK